MHDCIVELKFKINDIVVRIVKIVKLVNIVIIVWIIYEMIIVMLK